MTDSTGQVSLLQSVETGNLSVPKDRIIIIIIIKDVPIRVLLSWVCCRNAEISYTIYSSIPNTEWDSIFLILNFICFGS